MKQQAQVIGKYIMVVVVRVRTKKLSPVYFTIGHYEIYAGKKIGKSRLKRIERFENAEVPAQASLLLSQEGEGRE